MVRREYCFGIYMFIDNETGHIVYIGKDSHIDVQERIKCHYRPSAYNQQQINRVLQNNPGRYTPKVYCKVSNIEELNQLEFDLINLYRPKFNFKHGGEGGLIDKDFQYTVVKNGISPKGDQKYVIKSIKRKEIISSIDYNFLKKIALKLNNEEITPQQAKRIKRSIKPSLKLNLQRSKSTNSSGFYRVRKSKDNTCKQGFLWVYEYYDENKKHKKIQRVNLLKLKEEVIKRGMPWEIVDSEKAEFTLNNL